MIKKRSCWLVFDVNDIRRMYKRPTAMTLKPHERVVKVNLKYDDQMFQTPQFENTVDITRKPEIDIEVGELEKEIKALKQNIQK